MAAGLLAGCGGGGGKKTETAAGGRPALDPAKTYTVTMKTNEGEFAFSLDVKDSPNTTASFADLVKKGFFAALDHEARDGTGGRSEEHTSELQSR